MFIDVDTNNYIIGSTNVRTNDKQVEVKSFEFDPGYTYSLTSGNTIKKTPILKFHSNVLKHNSVAQIKVTTASGKVFDGDETSQDRMARAISIASISGQIQTQWKLADNTIVMVTLDELKEALTLAGQEMSRIWLGQ